MSRHAAHSALGSIKLHGGQGCALGPDRTRAISSALTRVFSCTLAVKAGTTTVCLLHLQILSSGSVNTGVGVYWMFYSGGSFEPAAVPSGLHGLAAGTEVEGLRRVPQNHSNALACSRFLQVLLLLMLLLLLLCRQLMPRVSLHIHSTCPSPDCSH